MTHPMWDCTCGHPREYHRLMPEQPGTTPCYGIDSACECDGYRSRPSEDPVTYLDSQRTTPPPRLAVDGDGFVWRVYNDGHWSMAPSNPDNSPVPEPITYYASIGEVIGFDEEIQASIEEARAEGRRQALAPVLDLIGWWEADGTESRKAAAERIRGVLRADAGECDCQ